MDPKLSLKTETEMSETLDYVVQQVTTGKLTAKQGDVVNTSCKQVLKMHDLKLKYLSFSYEVQKRNTPEGQMDMAAVAKHLPGFFLADPVNKRNRLA